MRKLITSLLIFFPIAIFSYSLFLFVVSNALPYPWRKNLYLSGVDKYDFTTKRLEELRKTKDIDILFMGSSHVYAGIDPRIFQNHGLTVFALGTSVQTPMVTEFLLERYLSHVNAKRVIFDLSPGSFRPDYRDRLAEVIVKDAPNVDAWIWAFKINNMKVYNTMISKFFKNLAGISEKVVSRSSDREYISGGYLNRKLASSKIDKFAAHDLPLAQVQVEAMYRIIDMLEKANKDYSFIQIPISKERYTSITNRTTFDSLISTFGTYSNFNKTTSLVDTIHFEDASHLNQLGVNEFNPLLIKYLKDSIL